MDHRYLVGRVPDEARLSFLHMVEEGELAQLKAFVEHAMHTNFDGGRFELWWRSDETAFGSTRIHLHDDTYLLRLLRQARAMRDNQRQHGLPLTDRSNAHLAWRLVRRRFRAAYYGF